IDDALELAGAHIEHQPDPRRHTFVEPDVRHRHSQFDVAHAFPTHPRESHFDAAAIADHTLVFDSLVLSAGALPVPGGTEDSLAKQTPFFRFESPVIDRLGVFDLALAPRPHRVAG